MSSIVSNVNDTYDFVGGKKIGNKTYVYCKERIRLQCKATGILVDGQLIWRKQHNHPINNLLHEKEKFKNQLKKAVTSASSQNDLRIIYDQQCRRNSIGSTLVPLQKVSRSMLRWRRKVSPPIPTSLIQYNQIINSEHWKHLADYDSGRITVQIIRAMDDSVMTVFFDLQFLRSLTNIKVMTVDTTFKICPIKLNIYQFLTIMIKHNGVAIPIYWVLMERKTIDAYKAAVGYFSRVLAPHIQPNTIMMDFEIALRTALLTVYPNAHIYHCWFHYVNCILKRVKKDKKTYNQLRNWHEGAIFIRKLLALPLLPAEKIPSAFIYIIENLSPTVYNTFTDLIIYYTDWWINKVTPTVFSIYGSSIRTNNDIESYHRLMHQRMKTHPSIWQFTKVIVEVQAVARSEYSSLNLGLTVRCQKKFEYSIKDEIIFRAWNLLQENRLTVRRFIACATFFINAFNNKLIIKNPEVVDAFISIENHNINRSIGSSITPNILTHEINSIFPIKINNGCVDVLLINKVELSICPMCTDNVADIVGLPCYHWYGCSRCAKNTVRSSVNTNKYHSCSTCSGDCLAFQTICIV